MKTHLRRQAPARNRTGPRRFLSLAGVLLALAGPGTARAAEPGDTGLAFLKIGVGARGAPSKTTSRMELEPMSITATRAA